MFTSALCIFADLFLQAIFMCTILSVPLASQLIVPFVNVRDIYEIRERPSRMYSWSALVTSQVLIEIPWNILGSTILFFTWFWTVGFRNDRAGYTYLMMGVINPLYYGSIGQVSRKFRSLCRRRAFSDRLCRLLLRCLPTLKSERSSSPSSSPSSSLCMSAFLCSRRTRDTDVLFSNGVMQPFRQLGWWQWMYRLSPYTYFIEGLLGQALGLQDINCSPVELVSLTPPSGQTCGEYMATYISNAGGYLTDPSSTSTCQFCSTRTTDQFLGMSFNIFYSNRWRDVGLMCAFTVFNVSFSTVCVFGEADG